MRQAIPNRCQRLSNAGIGLCVDIIHRMLRLASASVILLGFAAAQTPAPPSTRDIFISRPADGLPASLPRSFALVVGIAEYPKLPRNHWLRFPERDAEALYSVLISPAGGGFRAENVHKLIGPQATLANLARELEEWLPA